MTEAPSAKTVPTGVFRIARTDDARALAAIYAPYVRNTAISFEYEPPSDLEFAGRIAKTLEKYPYIVYEESGRPLAYAYASAFRAREAYKWGAELSVYVSEAAAGHGIGPALYGRLFKLLAMQRIQKLYAVITLPNARSVAMHEKLGFVTDAVLPQAGYKQGLWRDVLYMEKSIGAHAAPPPELIPFPALDRAEVEAVLAHS